MWTPEGPHSRGPGKGDHGNKVFPISYPIAYDVESQHLRDSGLTRQQITDNVNAFCRTITDAGCHPVVYANHEWLTKNMDTSQIPYDIRYARYGTINSYPNRTIWQCTDTGTVDGLNGNVTIELAFANYASLIPADGWRHVDGLWYYLDPNGCMIFSEIRLEKGINLSNGITGAVTKAAAEAGITFLKGAPNIEIIIYINR